MNRWIDYTQDERMTMILHVADVKQIDETAAEKDWWVTAVLYALFHTSGEPQRVDHDKDPSVISVKYKTLWRRYWSWRTVRLLQL